MSLASSLCESYRNDNRVTYGFLIAISKLNITTEQYAFHFIDKKADHYQIIVFKLEGLERGIIELGSLD